MEDPAGRQPKIPHGNRNTGALRGHIPPHILRHMGDKFHDFRRNHVGRVQLKLASKSLPKGFKMSSRGQGRGVCARRPRMAWHPSFSTLKGSNRSALLGLVQITLD
jgi:hypothetical protein